MGLISKKQFLLLLLKAVHTYECHAEKVKDKTHPNWGPEPRPPSHNYRFFTV
jgi:hypothetical protein